MMNNQQTQTKSENLFQWMGSSRLFERYFFFYFLIIGGIGVIGVNTLGFEITGFSEKENMLVNIVWVFILTLGMWFTPLWFRLLLGRRTEVLKDTQLVYEQLEELNEKERVIAKKQLANNGKLPPSTLQFAAMVFIGWYFLFEFCIVTSFVDDNHQLIWEPQWVQSLIEWGIDNTSTPAESPPGLGGRFALFYARLERFDFLEYSNFSNIIFNNELEFLHSSVGHVVMSFALWRLLSFIPVLIAFALVFAKMLGWLGLNGLNIRYAKNIVDFLGRIFFNLLISIFLVAALYNIDLSNSAESMISAFAWIDSLGIRLMMFIFTLIPIILICGWFSLSIQFIIKIKNLLIK